MTVPAGVIRDSLQLDLSLTTYGYYSASAGIAVRPHGTTTWVGSTSLIEVRGDIVNGTPQTGTLSQIQISLGNTIPLTTALDIQLYCDKGLGSYSCTWSNLRFFQDAPPWQPPQLSTLYGPTAAPMPALTARVTDTAFDGIAPTPDRGSFLALTARGAADSARYYTTADYRVPVQLPPLTATDVLSASMWWARTFNEYARQRCRCR